MRNLLKDKDIKDINDAFVEVYKALPKAKKEEIDPYIISIINGEGKKKPKPEELSLPELFDQISFLINNAYLGNYIGPNRIIPKGIDLSGVFRLKDTLKYYWLSALKMKILPLLLILSKKFIEC